MLKHVKTPKHSLNIKICRHAEGRIAQTLLEFRPLSLQLVEVLQSCLLGALKMHHEGGWKSQLKPHNHLIKQSFDSFVNRLVLKGKDERNVISILRMCIYIYACVCVYVCVYMC